MCWFAVCTVNSENFKRVYFRTFVKIKPLRNSEITMSSTDEGKTCPSRDFFASQICLSFKAIRDFWRRKSVF